MVWLKNTCGVTYVEAFANRSLCVPRLETSSRAHSMWQIHEILRPKKSRTPKSSNKCNPTGNRYICFTTGIWQIKAYRVMIEKSHLGFTVTPPSFTISHISTPISISTSISLIPYQFDINLLSWKSFPLLFPWFYQPVVFRFTISPVGFPLFLLHLHG